jgi:signal transduction histidine kinase
MELSGVTRLVEALAAEREARRQAEQELDRLRRVLGGGDAASQRSRFLVSMGHTLRTPLNAILGFSEVLLQEQCGPLNERQKKFVNRITDSGERQLGLINNLIDLARIHAGDATLERRPVDVAQLVQSTVTEFTAAAQVKGIELSARADETLSLTGDPERLRQALANLVRNAIQYTQSGGAVRVSVSHRVETLPSLDDDQGTSDVARIEIADTGNGIRPEDQEFLFDDFEHIESLSARRERRSGVGLALTRRIVELHHGRIWVESSGAKGEGSQFFIELPAKAAMMSAV